MKTSFLPLWCRNSVPLAAVIFIVLAFLFFANTFGAEWTYDDFPVIVENPDVRSWAGFLQDTYPGRPLRELTYLLDHALFGMEPAGWHIQSIFWHGLSGFLVFLFARRLEVTSSVAWVAALLFLVHPLQVEVVANISHRKDTLAVVFSLLSLLAYAEAFRPGRRRWPWIAGAFALAVVACLGKETAVTLPAVMAAYEMAFVPRERRFLLRRPPLAASVAALGMAGGFAWFLFGGWQEAYSFKMRSLLQFKANYFEPGTFETFSRMVLKSWSFLSSKIFWPSQLAVEYTYAVPSSWLDPWVLASLAAIVLYLVGLAAAYRRSPAAFVALVWTGACFLPVSNVWPLAYFAADRYLYAPGIGVFLLIALGVSKVVRTPAPYVSASVVVLLLLGTLTWRQNRVWLTPENLWTQAYAASPESSFVLNNLGTMHLIRGDLLRAMEFYDRAGKLNSLNPTSFYNMGLIYERRRDMPSAVRNYEWFLRIDHPMFRPRAEELRRRLQREYGIVISPDIAGQGPL